MLFFKNMKILKNYDSELEQVNIFRYESKIIENATKFELLYRKRLIDS